jgi:hypothetical protein
VTPSTTGISAAAVVSPAELAPIEPTSLLSSAAPILLLLLLILPAGSDLLLLLDGCRPWR